ncbi:MAG: matrixin family metalloprotease [Chloroflexi bacterium]|nr:matrixin family metalloprotease [Chloroflexota bacterium]
MKRLKQFMAIGAALLVNVGLGALALGFAASPATPAEAVSANAAADAAAPAANQPVCADAALAAAQSNFLASLLAHNQADTAATEGALTRARAAFVALIQACSAEIGDRPLRYDGGGVSVDTAFTAPGVDPEFVLNGRKWGGGPLFSPGGLVTYSFMPTGVSVAVEGAGAGDTIAISDLPTYQTCFTNAVHAAFDAWEAVADITFMEVPDSGVGFPVNAAGADGHIRIGGHTFDGPTGVLAHAYFPPPNGLSIAGDMHFDIAENWQCSAGSGQINFGLVTLHEIGHSIGINHEPNILAVMNAFYNPNLNALEEDDVSAAQAIYTANPAGVTPPSVIQARVNPDLVVANSGSSAQLQLFVSNLNASTTLTGITVSGPLPAGLEYVPGTFSNGCGGSIDTLTTTNFALSGFSLVPNAQCGLSVSLTGTSAGSLATVFQTTANESGSVIGTGDSAPLRVVPQTVGDFCADVYDPNWNGPLPISDNSTVSTTISIPDMGAISELEVNLGITHTYVGDMIIMLEHNGQTINLLDNPINQAANCSGNDLFNLLDDDASLAAQVNCTIASNPAQAYISGETYRPAEAFSAFDGMELSGDWTLSITDTFSGDPGTLLNWCINAETTVLPPPAAVLLNPTGNINETEPEFGWNDVPEADRFLLWISEASGVEVHSTWYDRTICIQGGCAVTPAGVTLNGGPHRWWVRTDSFSNGMGPWSDEANFTVVTPTLATTLGDPQGAITDTRPAFNWAAVDTATWYLLWVSGADGTPILENWYDQAAVCAGDNCAVDPLTSDLASGDYRWWVLTWSPFGGFGPWSSEANFTMTVPPAAANPTAPIGTTSDTQPTFRWDRVNEATWYLIWLSDVTGAGQYVTDEWFDQTAICAGSECATPATGVTLTPGNTYSWWVRTWNPSGGFGDWSSATVFGVDGGLTQNVSPHVRPSTNNIGAPPQNVPAPPQAVTPPPVSIAPPDPNALGPAGGELPADLFGPSFKRPPVIEQPPTGTSTGAPLTLSPSPTFGTPDITSGPPPMTISPTVTNSGPPLTISPPPMTITPTPTGSPTIGPPTNVSPPPPVTNTPTNTGMPSLTPTATATATVSAPTFTATATATQGAPGQNPDTIGLYRNDFAQWLLRLTLASGPDPDLSFLFGGIPNDLPLMGDWNGDGIDTVGVYAPDQAFWFLRDSNTTGEGDFQVVYGGIPGALPVVGDWDGDGVDTPGLYRPDTGQWLLRNSNTSGSEADIAFVLGPIANTVPVVGDWNGDGIDTVGFYNPLTALWILSNSNSSAAPDVPSFVYGGIAGGLPLTGDWDDNGTATVGIYVPNLAFWFMRNSNTTGIDDFRVVFGGIPGALPVTGYFGAAPSPIQAAPQLQAPAVPTVPQIAPTQIPNVPPAAGEIAPPPGELPFGP